MKILAMLAIMCLMSTQAAAFPFRKVLKVVGHLAIGAGTEVAVSQAAGGGKKWPAGLLAAGAVAGFKEGADAQAGRDTKKQAVIHALTIVAGAGAAALATSKLRR